MSRRMTKPTKWPVRPAKSQISLGIFWVFAVRMKKHWAINNLLSAHWRFWSDWADTQTELSLLWVHIWFCWFCRATAHIILRSTLVQVLLFVILHHTTCDARGTWLDIAWNCDICRLKLLSCQQKWMKGFAFCLFYGLLNQNYLCIWTTSWENLFLPYANNKGTDQPAHSRSLISVFVVRCLYSIMHLVSISKILSL